jgi:hypothetical protein
MSHPFSPDVLTRAVHDNLEAACAALPEGKSHALLLDASTDTGFRVMFVQRVGDGWNVTGHVAWDGHDRPAAGVSVLKAW